MKISPLVLSRCCCCWSWWCCCCSCFCCCPCFYYRPGGSSNGGSSRSRSGSRSSSSSSSSIWMRPGGKFLFGGGNFYFPGTPRAQVPFVYSRSQATCPGIRSLRILIRTNPGTIGSTRPQLAFSFLGIFSNDIQYQIDRIDRINCSID